MPSPEELARWSGRNQSAERGPVEEFVMEPLPATIVRAFPEMKEWEKKENERRVEFVKRLNTTTAAVPSTT